MDKPSNNRKDLEQVLQKDPVVSGLYQKLGLPPSYKEKDIYNALIRSIIGQQLSILAARTIYQRFLGLFDGPPDPQNVLEMDPLRFRQCGLSNQKAQYVRNVAGFFNQESLMEADWKAMPDQEIIDLLVRIKGVGLWTVQMLLMFPLDRPDIFPVDDLGIRSQMKKLYGLELEGRALYSALTRIAEGWQPYRTIVSKLIWMSKDEK